MKNDITKLRKYIKECFELMGDTTTFPIYTTGDNKMDNIYLICFRKRDNDTYYVYDEMFCSTEYHLMIILEELRKSGFDDIIVERVNDYVIERGGLYEITETD